MFGSVSAWFYRYLGGIQPNDNYPGFKKFIIAPTAPTDLSHVNCEYNSPFGKIISNWKKKADGTIIFNIEIPKGTSAEINLPMKELSKITLINQSTNQPIKQLINHFILNAGTFEIYLSK